MTRTAEKDAPIYRVGALPPYSVTYIDPKVCGTSTDQWFVMGTVDGDPRNQCGPVAICEYEPSAHAIAALLNATVTHDHFVTMPEPRRASWWRRLWTSVIPPGSTERGDAQ